MHAWWPLRLQVLWLYILGLCVHDDHILCRSRVCNGSGSHMLAARGARRQRFLFKRIRTMLYQVFFRRFYTPRIYKYTLLRVRTSHYHHHHHHHTTPLLCGELNQIINDDWLIPFTSFMLSPVGVVTVRMCRVQFTHTRDDGWLLWAVMEDCCGLWAVDCCVWAVCGCGAKSAATRLLVRAVSVDTTSIIIIIVHTPDRSSRSRSPEDIYR